MRAILCWNRECGMKRIIITGPNGYLANQLNKLLGAAGHEVMLLGVRTDEWKSADFSKADAVIHCAALVHKNEKEHSLEEYRAVNTELTAAVAEKAKREGVGLFVFFSTIAVYGTGSSCFRKICITADTPCAPKRKYAISKYEAEQRLLGMQSDHFRVAILRPPFIYGNGCPGNYDRLRKLVLKFGMIPKLENQYSMIDVGTLCSLVKGIVESGRGGLFLPQNDPVRSTWELAREIARCHNRRVVCTKLLNPLIKLASLVVKPLNKAFGSEYYDPALSRIESVAYEAVSFSESVRLAEQS